MTCACSSCPPSWPDPYCAMVLADLGAQVIKVEPPDGDPTRGYGPPWVEASAGQRQAAERVAAYYLSVNRNKRSLRLDLRQRAGVEVVERLIGRSDVLIENFRPGGLERLGLTETRLHELNPKPGATVDHRLRTLGAGCGEAGLRLHRPGGRRADVDHRRGRRGRWAADQGRGGHQRRGDRAFRRGRRARGAALRRGTAHRRVVARGHAGDAHQPGPERVRHRRLTRARAATPTRTSCPTRRSPRATARLPWRWAASGSGRGCVRRWAWNALAADERFATNDLRVRNRAVLRPLLAERFAARSSSEWLAALDAAGVPCGPVNDVLAAFAQPQARAREMEVTIEHPAWGRFARWACRTSSRPRRRQSAPRPHCSASTPTRSWPSSATTRRRSPRCAIRA